MASERRLRMFRLPVTWVIADGYHVSLSLKDLFGRYPLPADAIIVAHKWPLMRNEGRRRLLDCIIHSASFAVVPAAEPVPETRLTPEEIEP